MLLYYCILLFAFLGFSTTNNITSPVCESLSDELNLSEITENSFFHGLVEIGDEVISEKGCELLEVVLAQNAEQSEGSHSSFVKESFETSVSTSRVDKESFSAQAGPITSGMNRENCKRGIKKYHCKFKSCHTYLLRYESFCKSFGEVCQSVPLR